MTRQRLIYLGAAIAVTCVSLVAYLSARGTTDDPKLVTRAVTRGDIVQTVSATGTLEAVTTVAVGSQVSGTIQSLAADFNSVVRKGEVIAKLDPSLFDAQVQQARANLVRSEADAERLQVAAADADAKLRRAGELSEKLLIATADLEAADVAKRTADAQVRSAQAAVTQSRASLDQAEVTLSKTVITAPIDGIVIARNVDAGQTVAASVSAPTLFVLAADLSKMRLSASIDESDVGLIHEGQPVSFRVGAYPNETFTGTMAQLRLNPVVDQNVVTYAAIIDVPNPELKLKPGMTATVTVDIDRRAGVLRVPNAALQYRPAGEARGAGSAVWISAGTTVARVPLKTGVSDGTYTEVVSGEIAEGAVVVTGAGAAKTTQTRTTAASGNPFSTTQGPGGPPGGGRF